MRSNITEIVTPRQTEMTTYKKRFVPSGFGKGVTDKNASRRQKLQMKKMSQ